MIYGKGESLDIDRVIDMLQAFEKFVAVRDNGDGSAFKVPFKSLFHSPLLLAPHPHIVISPYFGRSTASAATRTWVARARPEAPAKWPWRRPWA